MFKMSRKLYDRISELGFDTRDDYSGRCMFGDTCFGFVTGDTFIGIRLFYEFLRREIEEGDFESECSAILNILDNPVRNTVQKDRMGLDYIVYFPDISVEEE